MKKQILGGKAGLLEGEIHYGTTFGGSKVSDSDFFDSVSDSNFLIFWFFDSDSNFDFDFLGGKAGVLEGKFHYGTAFGGSKVSNSDSNFLIF